MLLMTTQFLKCVFLAHFLTVFQRGDDRTGRADCHLLGRMSERVVFSGALDGSVSKKVMNLTMLLKLTFLATLLFVKAVLLFNTEGLLSYLFLTVVLRAIT